MNINGVDLAAAKAKGKLLSQYAALIFFIIVASIVMGTVNSNITAADRIDTLMDVSELPPCATEDSTNCFWNAAENGNGQGQSFFNIDGESYYLAGK